MILLYGISPELVKIDNEERMHLSTCKWRNRLTPLTLEQIALAQGSQGLNPVHFINKESGQQENSSCRKAYTDAAAGRNASRGLGIQGEPLNKSSTECAAVKIGMIKRRATKAVACAFTCV